MINIGDIKTDPAGQPDQHDMAAVTAIYRHHVLNDTASFEIEPPSTSEMATRMAQLLAGGYPILVAASQHPLRLCICRAAQATRGLQPDG